MEIYKKYCDCCGRLIGDGEFTGIIKSSRNGHEKSFELCLECSDAIIKLLDDRRQEIMDRLREEWEDHNEAD